MGERESNTSSFNRRGEVTPLKRGLDTVRSRALESAAPGVTRDERVIELFKSRETGKVQLYDIVNDDIISSALLGGMRDYRVYIQRIEYPDGTRLTSAASAIWEVVNVIEI
jgi:hypothetical protein